MTKNFAVHADSEYLLIIFFFRPMRVHGRGYPKSISACPSQALSMAHNQKVQRSIESLVQVVPDLQRRVHSHTELAADAY